MLNFENITRVAVAAAGALILSTLSVTAAVGPAHNAGSGLAAAAAGPAVYV
ncbi:MAG TPA: hypothetical protein VGX37_08115 [Allosphingosinicella sp.]|jgi:hypothetical protein|nr:hypothetical protein [Allosphingosinicella sp.]